MRAFRMSPVAKAPRSKAASAEPSEPAPAKAAGPFPTVGIGASAGGIEAFTALLRGMPENPGFSIIFVLHQKPGRAGALERRRDRAQGLPSLNSKGSARLFC